MKLIYPYFAGFGKKQSFPIWNEPDPRREVVHDHRMKTIMSLEQLTTIDAIEQFLEGTQSVTFSVLTNKQERYRWVQKTLVKHSSPFQGGSKPVNIQERRGIRSE